MFDKFEVMYKVVNHSEGENNNEVIVRCANVDDQAAMLPMEANKFEVGALVKITLEK